MQEKADLPAADPAAVHHNMVYLFIKGGIVCQFFKYIVADFFEHFLRAVIIFPHIQHREIDPVIFYPIDKEFTQAYPVIYIFRINLAGSIHGIGIQHIIFLQHGENIIKITVHSVGQILSRCPVRISEPVFNAVDGCLLVRGKAVIDGFLQFRGVLFGKMSDIYNTILEDSIVYIIDRYKDA